MSEANENPFSHDEAEDSSTHFVFKNRVFQFPKCYFERHHGDREPAFFLNYGDVNLSIKVDRLTKDFGLDPESSDAKILPTVIAGLSFVRRIHPGDSIPNELLDGTASWSVDERHLLIGRGRVVLPVAGITFDPEAIDPEAIAQILGDPKTEPRIDQALGDLASFLQHASFTPYSLRMTLDSAGRECAYIEALLDSLRRIKRLRDMINGLRPRYSRYKTMEESIGRIIALFERPLKGMNQLRERYIGIARDVGKLLITEIGPVPALRDVRDRLRYEVIRWEDECVRWEGLDFDDRQTVDGRIKELYGFMARNFPIEMSWSTPLNLRELRQSRKKAAAGPAS